jgi:urea transporter
MRDTYGILCDDFGVFLLWIFIDFFLCHLGGMEKIRFTKGVVRVLVMVLYLKLFKRTKFPMYTFKLKILTIPFVIYMRTQMVKEGGIP